MKKNIHRGVVLETIHSVGISLLKLLPISMSFLAHGMQTNTI